MLGLAACTSSASTATSAATSAPTVVVSVPTVTNAPASVTATEQPATPTRSVATETPASLVSETPVISPTLAAAETPTIEPQIDKAEFVADVTAPDGAEFAAETKFTKTWRLKNAGTTTWGPGYELVFVRGDQMGAPQSAALPASVAPGQTVDLSVELTAPKDLGRRTGFWQLRNAAGALFGVGVNGNEAFYVQITVTSAPGAQPTSAGPARPVKVTSVTLRLDNPVLTTLCPHTFTFIGILNVDGKGQVTYALEASSTTPGFQFDLPAPITATFTDNGPRTFGLSYTLEMRNSVAGQARLHVTAPNDILSEPINFNLTCG